MLGLIQAQKLKNRKLVLLDLQKTLLLFRTGIQYCAKPLEELIIENPSSGFCLKAAGDFSFPSNPLTALKNAGDDLLTDKTDMKIFCDFIGGLGSSDMENQLNHIDLYDTLVSQHLKEASDDLIKRSKLYVALGLFGGITVSMLIL